MTEQLRKKFFRIIGFIPLALAVGFTAFMFASSTGKNQTDTKSNKTVCEGICVALNAERAEPDTITVKVNEFVQFNSADGKTHNLSLGKGGEEHDHLGPFSSGDFKADEGWRVQFKEPGTFNFHDHYNPAINILVVVYTPAQN